MRKVLALYTSIGLITACSEPKTDLPAIVLSSPVFSASKLGMNTTQIQNMYPTAQPDGAGGLLFDTTYADGTTLSISFSFEDESLASVQADLAPSDQASADTIKARLARQLVQLYGNPQQEGDFLSWRTPHGLTDVADESSLFGRPHVSFTLYGFN